jgi:queuine/archaeosine tRNA-ribosyltransferase
LTAWNGAEQLSMALHNLDFFHEWMEEIQHNIEKERISEMLAYYLPKHTYMDILGQLSEILEP